MCTDDLFLHHVEMEVLPNKVCLVQTFGNLNTLNIFVFIQKYIMLYISHINCFAERTATICEKYVATLDELIRLLANYASMQ